MSKFIKANTCITRKEPERGPIVLNNVYNASFHMAEEIAATDDGDVREIIEDLDIKCLDVGKHNQNYAGCEGSGRIQQRPP